MNSPRGSGIAIVVEPSPVTAKIGAPWRWSVSVAGAGSRYGTSNSEMVGWMHAREAEREMVAEVNRRRSP